MTTPVPAEQAGGRRPARLSGPSFDEMTDRQRAIADQILHGPRKRLGPLMSLWLHSPELAEPSQRIGAYFRQEPGLPRAGVEMVILMTARHWDCAYEWAAHEPSALREGLDEAAVEAIRRRDRPELADEGLRAIHDFARSVLNERDVSDTVVDAVAARFGTRGVVEVSILIGHYVHGAILARAAGLRPPPGTPDPFASHVACPGAE